MASMKPSFSAAEVHTRLLASLLSAWYMSQGWMSFCRISCSVSAFHSHNCMAWAISGSKACGLGVSGFMGAFLLGRAAQVCAVLSSLSRRRSACFSQGSVV